MLAIKIINSNTILSMFLSLKFWIYLTIVIVTQQFRYFGKYNDNHENTGYASYEKDESWVIPVKNAIWTIKVDSVDK